MIRHIICPFHNEDTPSLALYHDGFHCFGCGRRGPLSDLGLRGEDMPPPKPAEDLEASLSYIDTLPRKNIRGFDLPYDDESYYIVWPDRSYYKARYFDPAKGKYRNPSGHKQTILVVRNEGSSLLIVVEGELNAMSVAVASPEADVWSPGAAGNFKNFPVKKHLKSILQYTTIVIVADRDAPGAEACIELMSRLQGVVPHVRAHLMSPDANELLLGGGVEVLRAEIDKAVRPALEESISKE